MHGRRPALAGMQEKTFTDYLVRCRGGGRGRRRHISACTAPATPRDPRGMQTPDTVMRDTPGTLSHTARPETVGPCPLIHATSPSRTQPRHASTDPWHQHHACTRCYGPRPTLCAFTPPASSCSPPVLAVVRVGPSPPAGMHPKTSVSTPCTRICSFPSRTHALRASPPSKARAAAGGEPARRARARAALLEPPGLRSPRHILWPSNSAHSTPGATDSARTGKGKQRALRYWGRPEQGCGGWLPRGEGAEGRRRPWAVSGVLGTRRAGQAHAPSCEKLRPGRAARQGEEKETEERRAHGRLGGSEQMQL